MERYHTWADGYFRLGQQEEEEDKRHLGQQQKGQLCLGLKQEGHLRLGQQQQELHLGWRQKEGQLHLG